LRTVLALAGACDEGKVGSRDGLLKRKKIKTLAHQQAAKANPHKTKTQCL
jgi:hypothetical protein